MDIGELTKTLEFTQEQFDEKISNIKKQKEISSKLIESEDKSCCNNLYIDGIQETPNETQNLCKEKIQNIIMNKLGINEIEQCHRMGCKQQNKSCLRTIVCCFSKLKEKRFG